MTVSTERPRSCFGVARAALSVFVVGMVLVYLFGGFDASVVAQ